MKTLSSGDRAAGCPRLPGGDTMSSTISRRHVLQAGTSALALAAAGSALAQGSPKMRFSSAFTEQDPRADAYKAFAAAMKNDFEFQPYWGNTLFKQGTELVA